MGALLQTALPMAYEDVDAETFNRLVRVLELNLSAFDPDTTNSILATNRDENKYNKGDIIWNLTTNELQVWDGARWYTLYSTNSEGVSASGAVGTLTVATNGNTSISISGGSTGWDTDTYYT